MQDNFNNIALVVLITIAVYGVAALIFSGGTDEKDM